MQIYGIFASKLSKVNKTNFFPTLILDKMSVKTFKFVTIWVIIMTQIVTNLNVLTDILSKMRVGKKFVLLTFESFDANIPYICIINDK